VVREVDMPPRSSFPYRDADWRDALVVVTRGEVELESIGGCRRRFGRNDVLWLAGLPLRAVHNRQAEPARLLAVARRPGASRAGGEPTDESAAARPSYD
jgi:hypothetical protein